MTPEIINAQNQVKELEVLAAQDSKRYGVDLNIWKQKLAQYQEHAIANSPEASALLKSNPAAYMQKYGSPTDIANLPQTLALKTGGATGYAPTTQPITNNVPSGGGSTYTPPQLTSNATNEAYYQGLNQTVANLTNQLETERQRQLERIQQDKQRATDELQAIRDIQGDAINEQGFVAREEKQKILDNLDIETKRFDENYNIVQ